MENMVTLTCNFVASILCQKQIFKVKVTESTAELGFDSDYRIQLRMGEQFLLHTHPTSTYFRD